MYYIDTDVLVYSLINQSEFLYSRINDIFDQLIANNKLAISWLSILETAFVLGKLNQPPLFISAKVDFLIASSPLQYGLVEFNRAVELAKIIGFKNFNDCLHTVIAEQHCSEIYTCNIKDFQKLKPHTLLKINFIK